MTRWICAAHIATVVTLRERLSAYEEGLFRENTRTRLMGWLIGDDGSDLFVGTARTRGFAPDSSLEIAESSGKVVLREDFPHYLATMCLHRALSNVHLVTGLFVQ